MAGWDQLMDYVSGPDVYACYGDTQKIAKALASTFGWLSSYTNCAPGKNMDENNATGLDLPPASYRGQSANGFGDQATIWSSTEMNNTYARNIYINYDLTSVDKNHSSNKDVGNSVRCIRN